MKNLGKIFLSISLTIFVVGLIFILTNVNIGDSVGILMILFTLLFTNLGVSFLFLVKPAETRKKASSIILIVGLFITIFSIFSKFYFHLPGSNPELVVGVFILCFGYGVLLTKSRFEKWLPFTGSKMKATLLSVLDLISISFIFLGVLFKLMYWPYATILLYLGLFSLLFTIKSWNNVFKKQIVLRKQAEDKLEKQKNIVEEKNREIRDSIEYALRIQTAILPPQKIVQQYLNDSFILYKPKDIVAGDFYWMETINELILFATCDCTGHGVPGAMVSVVCHNALNRAVREFALIKPCEILDKTTEIIIDNFSKSEDDIKDGMDISLCAYYPKTKTLQWAGANNPLWLLKNNELIETKADKQSIGKSEDNKPFINHEYKLNTGDTIYVFTDGFADQFGGEGEKKLTKRRFKELILSIQNISMEEQGTTLSKFITEYRKEIEQTDDILVMGVKI